MLAEHLHRLEEAERRDHRKLGVELDLFSFPDEVGSGLAVFHPKGGTVRRIMEDYSARAACRRRVRVRVLAPHHQVAASSRRAATSSGSRTACIRRWSSTAGTDYYLKPMNCPFHILIYRNRTAVLPRATAPILRVRHGVPVREVRRGARPHPRPWIHPGRRPHLLHQGGRSPRSCRRSSSSCSSLLRDYGLDRLLPRTLDQAGGARPSGPTRSGTRPPRRSAGRGRERRAGTRDGPRWRRVLRAEDLGAGA